MVFLLSLIQFDRLSRPGHCHPVGKMPLQEESRLESRAVQRKDRTDIEFLKLLQGPLHAGLGYFSQMESAKNSADPFLSPESALACLIVETTPV